MVCKKCGTEYEGNFCSKCGTPTRDQSQPTAKQPQAQQPVPAQAPQQNQQRIICWHCGLNSYSGYKCPRCGAPPSNPAQPENQSSQLAAQQQLPSQSGIDPDLFVVTKSIANILFFDEQHKWWYESTGVSKKPQKAKRIYSFSDVISCDLVTQTKQVTRGGKGGAIVGGMLLGGVGAIVGSNVGKKTTRTVADYYEVHLVLNDLSNPMHSIRVHAMNTGIAEKIVSTFNVIIHQSRGG